MQRPIVRIRSSRQCVVVLGVAVTAVLVGFTPTTAASAAGAKGALLVKPVPGVGGQRNVSGLTPQVKALMAAQEPLMRVANRIQSEAPDTQISGLAGLALDTAHRTVDLYWHGTLPAALTTEIAEADDEGIRVAVTPAAFSRSFLDAEVDRLMAAATPSKAGARLSTLSPRNDGSGLDIGVSGLAAGQAPMITNDASALVPGLKSTVPLHIHADAQHYRPLALRQADVPLYWAGGLLRINNNNAWCSSGFAVHDANGSYLMTAAHCGWTDYYTGAGVRIGRTVRTTYSLDGQIFSAASGGRVWDGTSIADTTGAGQFSKRVDYASINTVNEIVCDSGAFSGAVCDIIITNTDFTINGEVSHGILATNAKQAGEGIAGTGDSGGPMFTLTNNFNDDVAQGIVSSGVGFGNSTCRGVQGRACFDTVVFADFFRVAQLLGFTITTG